MMDSMKNSPIGLSKTGLTAAALFLSAFSFTQEKQPSKPEGQNKKESLLGTDRQPIRCQQPSGEGWYLSRLRTQEGKKLQWSRGGSTGGPALEEEDHESHILDFYSSDEGGHEIYMCMYHPQFIEIHAPAGFRILCEWSDDYEYVDGKVHKWGEAKPHTGKIKTTQGDEKVELSVKAGMIEGELRRFTKDGVLESVKKYDNDESNYPHGVYQVYKKSGELLVKYTFENGVLNGPFDFDPDPESGEKPMSGTYKNGRIVEE